ncbi:DCC-interacting protein 13-beta [Saguinus oedipus]|uniref:DCC-interacting protein 13-beta n=1 Tax=Saguinus oedipus TaxID=9490 RepID=A0ABQ9V059_SAGOE|nr:DCC-interacting protein 13-beta [Saguinus oedipus]
MVLPIIQFREKDLTGLHEKYLSSMVSSPPPWHALSRTDPEHYVVSQGCSGYRGHWVWGMVEAISSKHDLSMAKYSRLPKKKENEKVKTEVGKEVAVARRKQHLSSLQYYCALNALQYRKRMAMMEPMIGFAHGQSTQKKQKLHHRKNWKCPISLATSWDSALGEHPVELSHHQLDMHWPQVRPYVQEMMAWGVSGEQRQRRQNYAEKTF